MNTIKRHSVEYLKSISQAFFFDDPALGIGFLALLFCFDRPAFFAAMTASLAGYAYSTRVSTPRTLKAFGLIPINGLFFGLAMASLFRESLPYYIFLAIGALAVPMLTKAGLEVLQHWKLSPFISPYVAAIWMVWLCRQGASLETRDLALVTDAAYLIPGAAGWVNDSITFLWSSFHSVARLVFLDDPAFGILMLGLVTAFSPRRGFFYFVGTLLATAISLVLTGGELQAMHGLYGYSAGLVGLGLASFPERFKPRTILFFCAFSAVLTMALARLLGRMELPILSLPYVLTIWLALLSRTPRVSISWATSQGMGWAPAAIKQPALDPLKEPGKAA